MSYRRARNLKDQLVKSEIQKTTVPREGFLGRPRVGSFPCLSCINCKWMQKGNTFVHPSTGVEYPIKKYLTCNSDWSVYILWCPWGCLYVGETTCDIKTRLNNHKYTIRKGRLDLPVSKFFFEKRHNEWDLKFMVLDRIPPLKKGGDCLTLLKKRELRWIYELGTLIPGGLNVEFKVLSQMLKWDLLVFCLTKVRLIFLEVSVTWKII